MADPTNQSEQERQRAMLALALHCPFCGGRALSVDTWTGDHGEFDAVCCRRCEAAAPVHVWNRRSEPEQLEIVSGSAVDRLFCPQPGDDHG